MDINTNTSASTHASSSASNNASAGAIAGITQDGGIAGISRGYPHAGQARNLHWTLLIAYACTYACISAGASTCTYAHTQHSMHTRSHARSHARTAAQAHIITAQAEQRSTHDHTSAGANVSKHSTGIASACTVPGGRAGVRLLYIYPQLQHILTQQVLDRRHRQCGAWTMRYYIRLIDTVFGVIGKMCYKSFINIHKFA